MTNFDDFRNWLDANASFTKETKGNIVSRLRRADKLIPLCNDPVYLFNLSQNSEFNNLSVNVKSQIRRAFRLYLQYNESVRLPNNE